MQIKLPRETANSKRLKAEAEPVGGTKIAPLPLPWHGTWSLVAAYIKHCHAQAKSNRSLFQGSCHERGGLLEQVSLVRKKNAETFEKMVIRDNNGPSLCSPSDKQMPTCHHAMKRGKRCLSKSSKSATMSLSVHALEKMSACTHAEWLDLASKICPGASHRASSHILPPICPLPLPPIPPDRDIAAWGGLEA